MQMGFGAVGIRTVLQAYCEEQITDQWVRGGCLEYEHITLSAAP